MLYGPIYLKSDNGEGLITLDIYEDGEAMVCGIQRLEARFQSTTKWLTTIRKEIGKIERVAKEAGCTEMRVAGRDWSRVLHPVGYEYLMGVKNGLRKEL
jgi:hypothetical protein